MYVFSGFWRKLDICSRVCPCLLFVIEHRASFVRANDIRSHHQSGHAAFPLNTA